MDLQGRNKINSALKEGLSLKNGETRFFSVCPDDYELRGGDEADADAPERVTYIDIKTHADPSRVLECLRSTGLLETEVGASRFVQSPELRLLDISNNGHAYTLTFEDLAESR